MANDGPPGDQPTSGKPGWRRADALLLTSMAWLYLAAVLVVWAVLRLAGDRWWMATLLLFGPRWVLLLPAMAVAPGGLLFWRRSKWPALAAVAATAVVAGPVMGLCVSWPASSAAMADAHTLRIVTCNIHGSALNSAAFGQFIAQSHPDIVVLQEAPAGISIELPGRGIWHVRRDGELFLASSYPIIRVGRLSDERWPGAGDAVCYELRTAAGTLHLFNVHLDSPHQQLEQIIDREPGAVDLLRRNIADRWKESQRLGAAARRANGPVLIVGDFNTPNGSPIFSTVWPGFTDAFSAAGAGYGYTYYSRRVAVRIDHVLSSRPLRCIQCRTGPDVGSPHRPLLAVFEWGPV